MMPNAASDASDAHIRPQRRNKESVRSKLAADVDIDDLLSKTREQLDSLLTVSSGADISRHVPSCQTLPPIQTDAEVSNKPVGILRKPKYSTSAHKGKPNNTHKTSTLPYSTTHKSEVDPIVKEFVVERDVAKDKSFSKIMESKDCNHRSVEGYTPRHGEKDEKEVVIKSISDLVEKAGLLPEQDSSSISDAKVVEAKLEFSVLSPEEYEEQERSRLTDHIPDNQPIEVFQGQMDIFSDDEYSDDMDFLNSDRDDDDSEYWSRDDDYMEEMPAPEPRAFMKLWDAISDLITPESYDLVKKWHKSDNAVVDSPNWNSTIDASEIAASRCAGLMALLNLHIHKSLDDLDQPEECVNSAKRRLGDLLRTFNYSRPTAKLNSKMWRAMTCIFIAIVLRLDVARDVPASLQSVGMTLDEYKYLVHSCMRGLYSDSNA